MEKREKRPGYFARLKKRRQLKQSQSDPGTKAPIICEPNPSRELQEYNADGEQQRREGPKTGSRTQEGDTDSSSRAKREKRRPPGTVEYTVGPADTLNSIALKFNITPNKLVQLNRLFSRSVVPGQRLFVPDVGQSESGSLVNGSSDPASTVSSEKEFQDGDCNGRAGRPVHRELSPPSEDDSPATVKFLKMSCKYFTDGMGVVGGVMIVTPNNIMFDPHKSDPLVIEHGCEEYGLICPMEEVVSIALYNDISRMKLKDALPSDRQQDLCPLYRPGEWEELPSERDLNPFSRYEALHGGQSGVIVLGDEATEGCISAGDAGGGSGAPGCPPDPSSSSARQSNPDSSPSDEGFTELELPQGESGPDTHPLTHSGPEAHAGTEQALRAVTADPSRQGAGEPTCLEEDEGLFNPSTSSAEHTPEQDPVAAGEEASVAGIDAAQGKDQSAKGSLCETTGDSGKRSPPVEEEEELPSDPALSEEERRRRSNEAEMQSWLLKRMQGPITDLLLSSEEKSKMPPMFLCFKVGQPMRKSFAAVRTSSPVHSPSRGKQPEYWFAVPHERVDHLYSFLVQWSPDAYGKDARDQGFVVVETDELDMIDNFFSDPGPRSWEIITIDEAKRRQSFGSFEEGEQSDLLPALTQPSTLLQDTHIEKLAARLPARVQGYPWRLAYSTVEHGTSLKTLYRNLSHADCPVLLAIKDMDNQLFGAFSTHPFRVSEHYYATGETFLFSFNPEIKVFRWTGENSYFVKGNIDSLQMGGGGGQMGLWLDAGLFHGSSSSCSTFHNKPLASQQDFTIQSLEVWAFE